MLEGLSQQGGGLEISEDRVVLGKLLWETAGAGPEATGVQVSGNRCVYQLQDKELIPAQACS